MYFAGDGAKRDEDGYFWLLGRVDDVMNVAGHRISDHRGRVGARSTTRRSPRRRSWASTTRSAARRSSRSSSCGPGVETSDELGTRAAGARRARSSGRSPGPSTCCSRRTCPRRARARSCAGCCATSPRGARWVTRRRWPMRAWWRRSAQGPAERTRTDEVAMATRPEPPVTARERAGPAEMGRERGFALLVGSILIVLGLAGSLGTPIVGGADDTGLIVTGPSTTSPTSSSVRWPARRARPRRAHRADRCSSSARRTWSSRLCAAERRPVRAAGRAD